MSIRIILADDHRIMRDGLRVLLEKESGFQVIAEAEDGRTTVNLASELKPDVVIMDISMPELNGIEATRKIRAKDPDVCVLVLSMHSDKRFVGGALSAGVSGYLLKDCANEELIQAIRAVIEGNTYLSPKIANTVVQGYIRSSPLTGSLASPTLTTREREVLQLIAEGKTTKEIASILNVSVKTIETHRNELMKKLNTHSVAGLTKYAIREGLVGIEE